MEYPVVLVERRERGQRSYLKELKLLAEAAGYRVVGILVQVRRPDSRYQIGPGKVLELKRMVEEKGAKKVIFFNELKPVQAYNLQKELGVEVIDRFQLILEIFAQRAGTREAKLQIELARLKRQLSYIKEALHLAKIGEYPGFMSGGEYAIDAYYYHVVRRISLIERELKKIRARKSSYWCRRIDLGLPSVALTGYTGAGKSTLFMALTGRERYVDGKPFATLSTKVCKTKFDGVPVLVSDTIGFIDCLPPLLVDAFYTTLSEIAYADLVLLVVDISEEQSEIRRKLNASLDVLYSMGITESKILVAANKVDLIGLDEALSRVDAIEEQGLRWVAISALRGYGLDELKKAVLRRISSLRRVRVAIPAGAISVVRYAEERAMVKVLSSENGELLLEVCGKSGWINRFIRKVESCGGAVVS